MRYYNQTKTEFQLPVTTEAKLTRQMVVQKEVGFIRVLCNLGEFPFKASFCHGKSPAILSKTKTNASAQSFCSILKYSP